MDLLQLKTYLRARKTAPLQDMALHFQTDIETVRPLLTVWIEKGKARRWVGAAASCKGCSRCHPTAIEIYEWIE